MATPILDLRPAYYIGQFYRGSRIVIPIRLAGFGQTATPKINLFQIADALGTIPNTPLSDSLIEYEKIDAQNWFAIIEATISRTLDNTFGYFVEMSVDEEIIGIATWTLGRFVPTLSTTTNGDEPIVLSAGGGSQIVLTNPSAPVDYVLTAQQVADAYNQLPVQHNLNTLYCEVHAWTADGRPITDVLVVPWIGDTTNKPPANWSEVQLRQTSDSADKATRIMITSPSPLL